MTTIRIDTARRYISLAHVHGSVIFQGLLTSYPRKGHRGGGHQSGEILTGSFQGKLQKRSTMKRCISASKSQDFRPRGCCHAGDVKVKILELQIPSDDPAYAGMQRLPCTQGLQA
jgi:hypothetical protein